MSNWKSLLYIDKPVSLSVKSFLIRKIATSTMIPEKTLEIVINHQFTSMLEAMPVNNSIELSGFGKFLFHKKKTVNFMKRLLNEQRDYTQELHTDLTVAQRKLVEMRLSRTQMKIKAIKPKLQTYENEFRTDL